MPSDFESLVGKTITKIEIADDKTCLRFFEASGEPLSFYAEGQCCSTSWFESVSGIENILGQKVLKTEAKPEVEPNRHEEDAEKYIKIYGFCLSTEKGYFDIEMRNSSNGYYGGSISTDPSYGYNAPFFKTLTDF